MEQEGTGYEDAQVVPAQALAPMPAQRAVGTLELTSEAEVDQAIARLRYTAKYVRGELEVMRELIESTFQDGVHMGVIPGTEKKDRNTGQTISKPVLYKPGAELLTRMFRLRPITVERKGVWDPDAETVVEVTRWVNRERVKEPKTLKGFLRHTVTIQILREDGTIIAEATGTANSWEKKYYWADPLDVDNTILQMAYKRAFVQAVRQATATSGYFSVDEEKYARPEGNQGDVDRAQGVEPTGDATQLEYRKTVAAEISAATGVAPGEILATYLRLDWAEKAVRAFYQTPTEQPAQAQPEPTPAAAPAPQAAPTATKKKSTFLDL